MMPLVFLVNSIIISLAVLIHYEFLFRISTLMSKIKIKLRHARGGSVRCPVFEGCLEPLNP
ncbi:hypothetical protein MNBD_GAMMA09-2433 [hydrothermal vent metagenome]|uniref:Uncharacterized protein n=1 Tax=hydrothermal vent metagenome TaxID=652676 RepID=A0A3B0XVA6_9ZZZZ